MIQVVYIRYGEIIAKRFSGETEKEDALSFIDALENYAEGVIMFVTASEWKRTEVGERSERLTNGTRIWVNADREIDNRLKDFVARNLEQPCLHCDTWCHGRCRGATRCIQAGKPGHTHCKSRLIEEGILKRRD